MNEQYEEVCKDEFAEIHKKLDKIDVSIRGNGKPGIITRLDRLEQTKILLGKLFWVVLGIAGTVIVKIIYVMIAG